MNAIEQQLCDILNATGMSQRGMAARSGVDVGVISRLLSGARGVTIDTAERLADAFGYRIIIQRCPGKGRATRAKAK